MNKSNSNNYNRLGVLSLTPEEAPPPGGVVEVPLLLSVQQIAALEEAAHHRGLTAGEMVRRLLCEAIAPRKRRMKDEG